MPTGPRIDPSNTAQLDNWNGGSGDFWAANADRFDEGVAAYRSHFLAAAAIEESEAVLDIGCGTGQTTRDAARLAANGTALGVDLSSRMIELARRRAEDEKLPNAIFAHADAQIHPFARESVDVAVSRHGTMFFGDPVAAFTNIARTLRPGGRLALLTWQPIDRNEWFSSFFGILAAGRDLAPPPADAPSPFALSDPDRVRRLLTSAGFSDVRLRGLDEPMYFGRDPDDAFRFVSHQNAGMVRDLDPDTRSRALDDLRADLAGHHGSGGVVYDSATWLTTAIRGS